MGLVFEGAVAHLSCKSWQHWSKPHLTLKRFDEQSLNTHRI